MGADQSAEQDERPVAVTSGVSSRTEAPALPFVLYACAWALFAGLVVWRLLDVPPGVAAFESSEYDVMIAAGITLLAAGPVTMIAVWLFAARSADVDSGAVLFSALTRGSLAMLVGVCLWWIALVAVDQLRLGRVL